MALFRVCQKNVMRKGKHDKKKKEFSKVLLIQESILVWIHTLSMIVLAYICIVNSYYSELPWLTAMVALPWGAYGVSQHAYYKKAEAENTQGGIKYETVMADYMENLDPETFDDSAVG